jgi:Flp pilus assembly protein TadD
MINLTAMSADDLKRRVNAAVHRSDHVALEAALLELMRRSPSDVETVLRLTAAYKAQGARALAVASARRGVAVAPRDARAHTSLATSLRAIGRFDEAVASFETALALAPKDVGTLVAYGDTLERLRRLDAARAAADRAIAVDPHFGPAANLLGQIESIAGNDELAERWLTRAIGSSMQPEMRSTAWHRMGALRERAERWDEAMGCHTTANTVMLATPMAQRLRERPVFHMLPHQFLPAHEPMLARWSGREFAGTRADPVFLVGFPRSGTTMLESVLAALPGVVPSDEQPVLDPAMRMAVRMCGDPTPEGLPAALDGLTHDQLETLREEYWRSVGRMVSPEAATAPVFVDKTPLRFIHLLYVSLLFPRSRVVFLVRDPRDVCLSCYFQDFAMNAVLARFLALDTTAEAYADAMGFWLRARSALRVPWMEVRYEDLATDFETHARGVVEFLGLPWTEDASRFYEKAADRPIRTPSYLAVTERAHTRAIGKWRHYRAHLGPVLARVDPMVSALGYAAAFTPPEPGAA